MLRQRVETEFLNRLYLIEFKAAVGKDGLHVISSQLARPQFVSVCGRVEQMQLVS
jgi:hypothetical protein